MADVDVLLRLMAQNSASGALDQFGAALARAKAESETLSKAFQGVDASSVKADLGVLRLASSYDKLQAAASRASKAHSDLNSGIQLTTKQHQDAERAITSYSRQMEGFIQQGVRVQAMQSAPAPQEDPIRRSRGGFGAMGGLMDAAKYSALYGGIYAGYSAVSGAFSDSLAFSKTLYSTQALTGLTDAQRNQVQANVYASAGSGGSQFDPNTTLGAQYAALSTVPNVKVAGQISAAAMKAAAVSNVTDPTDYGNAITTLEKSYYGGNIPAIGANANMVGSQLLYAIRQGKANPADIPGAVGTFASSAANAGAKMPDILGLFAEDTLASRDARVSGQGMEAFLRDIGKPGATYMAEAKKLGISQYFGPDAIKKYGVGGVLSGIEGGIRPTAAGGDHQDEFISLLFGQQNARDVFKRAVGPGGSNLGATLGAIQGQRQAGASYLDTANDQYMKSPAAQLTGAMNSFKTSAQQFADAATPLAVSMAKLATDGIKVFTDLTKDPGGTLGDAANTLRHLVTFGDSGFMNPDAARKASGADKLAGKKPNTSGGFVGTMDRFGSWLSGTDTLSYGDVAGGIGHGIDWLTGGLDKNGSIPYSALPGMSGGAKGPALPAGIFATHGGYENQKTHVLYQTIAEAVASLGPSGGNLAPSNFALGPGSNAYVNAAISATSASMLPGIRTASGAYDVSDPRMRGQTGQMWNRAYWSQFDVSDAGRGDPGAQADAALAARQAAARAGGAGKGMKGLPTTLDPYQSSQDTMSLAIMQQQNPAHIRQALGGVLWQIAHSGADPAAQDLASAQARSTANTAIAAELKAPADRQMAAAQLFQQTVQIHGGNVQQQQAALNALIMAMHGQGAGLKGADLANWNVQTGNTQFLGQQAIDQSTVGRMQSQLALARSKGDIKGERRISGQIASYQAANAAYLFPGDTAGLNLSNQGLTQGVGSDQATLLQQQYQLAQAQGNGKLASSLIGQILAADKTSGMNPTMLALTRIQLEGGIPQKAGPQNIRPANMGPGDLEATSGNVAGRSARLGGQDAGQRQVVAIMQQQLEAAHESLARVTQQLADTQNALRESRKQTALQQKMLAALMPETKSAPVAAQSSRTARHVAGH